MESVKCNKIYSIECPKCGQRGLVDDLGEPVNIMPFGGFSKSDNAAIFIYKCHACIKQV